MALIGYLFCEVANDNDDRVCEAAESYTYKYGSMNEADSLKIFIS